VFRLIRIRKWVAVGLIVLVTFTITYSVCRFFDEQRYYESGGKKPYWWTPEGLRMTFYGSILAWGWFIFSLIAIADFLDRRKMMKKTETSGKSSN